MDVTRWWCGSTTNRCCSLLKVMQESFLWSYIEFDLLVS